ncbi:hypothetical protein GALMADRAFT_72471, partial [Galerina marginata CBS 339.88]
DPGDPDERDSKESLEYAHFKRTVYQKVASKVFSSLRRRSHSGEAMQCGDGVNRVLHPGILINSLDGEEANCFCACRASSKANYPCPKCLVRKDQMYNVTGSFEARTSDSMRSVILRASQASTKTEKEKILQAFGLHDIQHFLWDFRFSDPYAASSYDTLHSDDLGKWGKHMWELLLTHFSNVSTTTFGDGQAFYDILKVFFNHKSYKSATRSKLCKTYNKNPNFPKQHAVDHVIAEIRAKGTTDNYGTRVGEGFQQESSQAYDQTNGKNAEDQMAKIDEKQEAIAKIRMAIDNDVAARAKIAAEAGISSGDFEEDSLPILAQSAWAAPNNVDGQSPHWKFGSPEKPINSRALDTEISGLGDSTIKDFDERLRDFLSSCLPDEAIRYEDQILIRLYKFASLTYQSCENWTESRDILRCSRHFHGQERYDCILSESDNPALQFSRLKALIRCKLPSGRLVDIALVHKFNSHGKWKPNTIWDGCIVLEEDKLSSFLLMDEAVRGALLAPAFGSKNEVLHYFVDTTDGDMFLRAGN